VKTPWS